MADDPERIEQLSRIELAFAAGEAVDAERIEAAYAARCLALGIQPILEPPLSPAEEAAARLIPKRTGQAAAPATGSPGRQTPLSGATAVEARQFADGSRSILDVRNALSAEFGPVALDSVLAFFRHLEQEGTWTIEEHDPATGRE